MAEALMPSESARAASAAESRFRIDAPNSTPRIAKIIALDAPSERVAQRLAQGRWAAATFLTASNFARVHPGAARFSMAGWLSDLTGRTKDLVDEIAGTDLVVMLGTPGEDTQAAAIIAEACHLNRVMVTVLILGSAKQSDEALAKSLAQLRPYAAMLVIANDEDYLEHMLTALRA